MVGWAGVRVIAEVKVGRADTVTCKVRHSLRRAFIAIILGFFSHKDPVVGTYILPFIL